MTATHVILAAASNIPLGGGDYLLAVNQPKPNVRNAPFLGPIGGALATEDKVVQRLVRLGAYDFAHNGTLSFMMPPDKIAALRNWFITGHDRDPRQINTIVQTRLGGIDFANIEPFGLVRSSTAAEDGTKVVIFTDVYTAHPSEQGRQSIEDLLCSGYTLVTRVCEKEIRELCTLYGGSIDSLTAQMLSPALRY